jgi:hypothetical protein
MDKRNHILQIYSDANCKEKIGNDIVISPEICLNIGKNNPIALPDASLEDLNFYIKIVEGKLYVISKSQFGTYYRLIPNSPYLIPHGQYVIIGNTWINTDEALKGKLSFVDESYVLKQEESIGLNQEITIGSSQTDKIQIKDDMLVSAKHLKLICSTNGISITDTSKFGKGVWVALTYGQLIGDVTCRIGLETYIKISQIKSMGAPSPLSASLIPKVRILAPINSKLKMSQVIPLSFIPHYDAIIPTFLQYANDKLESTSETTPEQIVKPSTDEIKEQPNNKDLSKDTKQSEESKGPLPESQPNNEAHNDDKQIQPSTANENKDQPSNPFYNAADKQIEEIQPSASNTNQENISKDKNDEIKPPANNINQDDISKDNNGEINPSADNINQNDIGKDQNEESNKKHEETLSHKMNEEQQQYTANLFLIPDERKADNPVSSDSEDDEDNKSPDELKDNYDSGNHNAEGNDLPTPQAPSDDNSSDNTPQEEPKDIRKLIALGYSKSVAEAAYSFANNQLDVAQKNLYAYNHLEEADDIIIQQIYDTIREFGITISFEIAKIAYIASYKSLENAITLIADKYHQ